jgi:elongation factor 2
LKNNNGNSTGDLKEISTILVQQFGWSKPEATRIWCFEGANCLVDATHGVQYMNEIRDSVVAAFASIVQESIVAGEPLHGVRVNIVDAQLHADAIHRGGGQIIPCARKAIQGCILDAQPCLLEPVFLAEIVTEQEVVAKIRALVIKLRGYVVEEYPKEGTPLYIVKAHLPVLESFGFSADMQGATSGRAFPQLVFSHWQNLPGDPFATSSLAARVVKDVRERKRLPAELPKLANYQEKL